MKSIGVVSTLSTPPLGFYRSVTHPDEFLPSIPFGFHHLYYQPSTVISDRPSFRGLRIISRVVGDKEFLRLFIVQVFLLSDQKLYKFSAGYSEDSDYTSDLNYPVGGQGANSSASQFRTAANQLATPQRSLETSRENSYERDDHQVFLFNFFSSSKKFKFCKIIN